MRALVALLALVWMGEDAPAQAQVVRGNQVVVTANMIDRDASDVPHVSVIVRADFVLFSVALETGTRSLAERETELTRTFRTYTERADRSDDVDIEVGQPGNSAAVETATAKEIVQSRGQDRSGISVVLKMFVRPDDTFDAIRARAEKFVADAPLAGRVEAIVGDNQFLGLSDPKVHRTALLQAIADDTALLRTMFAAPDAPASLSLTGMESRVVSRPVGPLDMEIYIPYSMSLVSGVD
ncbi:MAG: hypothetical protein SGJ21_13715 [Alphaproteobacteria bacterium]|nr:hypothetical protein [Alphaproteobacteria bacterium]